MTPIQQFILGILGQIVILIGVVLNVIRLGKMQIKIDGRLSELLESRGVAERSQGELKGQADERARQAGL